jgi:hypothetical protein
VTSCASMAPSQTRGPSDLYCLAIQLTTRCISVRLAAPSGNPASSNSIPGPCGPQGATTSTRDVRSASEQWDMIRPPVPNGGEDHPICRKCHDCAEDGSSGDIVPVVEFVDDECAAHDNGPDRRGICEHELPMGGVLLNF